MLSMRYRMLGLMTVTQVCAAIVTMGFGSLAPFVVSHFHISKAVLGVSFGALMVGGALTALVGGAAADRFGERTITFVGGMSLFVTLCISGLVPSYAGLIVALLFVGIASSTISPAGGRAILGWFDRDRGFAMGIRQTGIPAGAGIGGLLLPYIAYHWDYRAALIAGGCLALFGTAGLALLYRDPEREVTPVRGFADVHTGIRAILADPRTIPFMITCMILNSVQLTTNGFLVLSVIALAHASVPVAAFVFTTMQITAIAGRIAWGKLSDVVFHGDRTLPMAFLCAIGACAVFGLAAAPNLPVVFICALIIGATGIGWTGLWASAFAEIGGVRFAGSALGMGATVNFAAAIVAPVAFGAIADAYGLHASWAALGTLLGLGTIPALVAHRRASHGGLLEGGPAAHG